MKSILEKLATADKLSVFDHFVNFALKGLKAGLTFFVLFLV